MDLSPKSSVSEGGSTRLFLCGDVMTGRGVDQILLHPGEPRLHERWAGSADDYVRLAERRHGPIPRRVAPSYVWGVAVEEWRKRAPEARIGNLETSVTRSRAFLPKGINYRMSPANVGCLTAAGFSCWVLANNHVLDFGSAGLIETLDTLQGQRLTTAGAGRNLEEAARPAVIDLGPNGRVLTVGLGAASSGIPHDWAAGPGRPGINMTDLSPGAAEAIAAKLEPLRRPGDVVVASIHWGPNWGYDIPDAQRRFAHALIDAAGVSLVHGHSSHHAKAMEVYKGRLILYGCGDFLTDYEGIEGYEAFRGDLPVMYFADVDRRSGALNALEMVPLKLKRFQLTRPSSDEIAWVSTILDREAGRYGGRVAWIGDRLALSASG